MYMQLVFVSSDRSFIGILILPSSFSSLRMKSRRGEPGNNKPFQLLAHAPFSHSSQRSAGSRERWRTSGCLVALDQPPKVTSGSGFQCVNSFFFPHKTAHASQSEWFSAAFLVPHIFDEPTQPTQKEQQ